MTKREKSCIKNYLVVIDEISIWRVFRLVLAGHTIYHFRTEPILNISARFLDWVVRWAFKRGLIQSASNLAPEAAQMVARARLFGSLGWYRRVEPVFFAATGLLTERPDPCDLMFPLKKQTANYIADHFDALFFAYQLRESGRAVPILLFGNPAARELVAAAVEHSASFQVETVGGGRWLNPLIVCLMLAATSVHILRRLSWHTAPKMYRYLGVDGTDSVERTLGPVRPVLGSNFADKILVIFRNEEWYQQMKDAFAPLQTARPNEGQFTPMQAIRALARSLRDTIALCGWLRLYPAHFIKAAKIVHLRNLYDGFFNKYHFDVFFAYDEYNADHILRTEAMRKRGIRSVARINGVNVFKVDYAFRYIDFDSGYVISEAPMKEFNGDTWRKPNSIKGFGTFGLNAADLNRVADPRPKDILCFAKPWFDGSVLPHMMVEVAKALPDRRITIAAKKSSKRFGGYEEYLQIVKDGPSNLILSDEDSFQLILKHQYCLCSESSILAEAMELRCDTFFLNIHGDQHVLLYRDYPDIGVFSARDIVERIEALERGSWTYPREKMGSLIKLSDVSVYELMRRDWDIPFAASTELQQAVPK